MSSFSYFAFGLSIHSGFELHSLNPVELRSDYDLTLNIGKIESCNFDHEADPVIRKETKAGHVVFIRDIAAFLIQHDKITIEVLTDRFKLIESVLINDIFPILLSIREHLIIRGAAIVVNDTAFLLVGVPGIGKSSILAGLYNKGYSILSDQFCVLKSSHKNQIKLIPSLTKLKLWEDSLQILDIKYEHLEKVREEIPKYYFDATPKKVKKEYPISGIIILKITELLAEDELKSFDLTTLECFENLSKNGIVKKELAFNDSKKNLFQELMNLSSISIRRLVVRPNALFNIISFVNYIELELQNKKHGKTDSLA